MLRNLNHHHHHHAVVGGGAASSAGGPPPAVVSTATVSVVRAPLSPPTLLQPSLTPSAGGFSIYSRNISFEQDYRSNYTYQNASFVAADISGRISGAASPTYVGSGVASSVCRATATAVSEAEQLMAGLARQGFYVTKSAKGAQLKPKPKTLMGSINNNSQQQSNNNNSYAVANNNLRLQQQHAATVVVNKGVVDILHNYSKQRCEEETDRLRMRKAAAMRQTKGYVDEDEEEEEDDEEEEEDVDEEDDTENVVVDDDEDEHVDVTADCDGLDVPMVVSQPIRVAAQQVRESVIVPPVAAASPSPSPPSPTPPPLDEKPAPEHHARRPMNAFLIFCKRHRAIVREKYPNLENRAITKILGDWWANIDGPEKESFNRLASEYKDAFFSANPTFQWYKLPAPPLRTLNSRPSAVFVSESMPCTRASPSSSSSSHVGMFKLADEAHMGGLNVLMGAQETMSSDKTAASRARSEADKKNSDLQAALGDATSYFAKTMSTNRTEPFRHYRVVKRKSDPGAVNATTADSASQQPPAKRSVSESSIVTSPVDFERFVQANFNTITSNETLSSEDDSGPTTTVETVPVNNNTAVGLYPKSTRACKGKRYLEFINTVRVATAAPKKQQPSKATAAAVGPTPSITVATARIGSEQQFDHMYASRPPPLARHDRDGVRMATTTTTAAAAAADAKALIDTADFDLNGRIMALLALSLDEYLSRKRDTKKKKKITVKKPPPSSSVAVAAVVNRRPKSASASMAQQQQQQQLLQQQRQQLQQQQQQIACMMRAQTALERREQIQSAAVGSQKRKARKESITRRDIVSSSGSTQQQQHQTPQTPQTPPTLQPMSPQPQVASPDLFILAQVAAIITSK